MSALSVWWIKPGITPELIQPAHPEQNGRHERMYRTLKAEATRPAAATLRGQQRRFDHFQREYNEERPHEALAQVPPAQHYRPSPRPDARTLRVPSVYRSLAVIWGYMGGFILLEEHCSLPGPQVTVFASGVLVALRL